MENILKKASEAGYHRFVGTKWVSKVEKRGRMYQVSTNTDNETHNGKLWYRLSSVDPHEAICDPIFWQSLGKACGWTNETKLVEDKSPLWKDNAITFFEINLTQGFDDAVGWLNNLIK